MAVLNESPMYAKSCTVYFLDSIPALLCGAAFGASLGDCEVGGGLELATGNGNLESEPMPEKGGRTYCTASDLGAKKGSEFTARGAPAMQAQFQNSYRAE